MNKPSYLLFKKCSKCGEILHVSKFNKSKSGKYGVRNDCKECRKKYREGRKEEKREYNKKYYEENKGEILERQKQYYEDNKDYYKEYNKQYYEENKGEILERQKEYREEHEDYYKEYSKKYYENNKEEISERHSNYYKENKEKIDEYNNKWRKENQDKWFNYGSNRREKINSNGITKEQWIEMMDFFSWKCAYSDKKLGNNKDNIRTVDHIVPLAKNGEHEIWNCVPMYRPYNSSKNTKDMLSWYIKQEYFDINRLTKIYEWRIYAYWKWNEI